MNAAALLRRARRHPRAPPQAGGPGRSGNPKGEVPRQLSNSPSGKGASDHWTLGVSP